MEKWILWCPTDIPAGKYELTKIQQDYEGLKLYFDDERISVEVIYDNGPAAFRSCDEGDRWKTVDRVLSENGADFFRGKLFFKVENSEFKKWFEEERFGMSDSLELTHYAFVTRNDIIDVLSLYEPEIKIKQLTNRKNYSSDCPEP